MHPRLLNTISFLAGTGISVGIFLSIARFLSLQEESAPPVQSDLEMVALAMPPPPPPPKPDEKPAVVEEVRDAIPLGFQEETSTSPVKVAPSPPNYDQLLPMSQLPTHIIAGTVGLNPSFQPKVDLTFDSDHIFQKTEVDQIPVVISRPNPKIPSYVRDNAQRMSVVVLYIVDSHGAAGNVRVLRSSGSPKFDAIIADWVTEWVLSPAIKKGKPVRCMIQQALAVQWERVSRFAQ
jgi:TonB family protein